MSNERYYCANCLALCDLNQHGRCATCDSSQVVSEHAVLQAIGKPDERRRVLQEYPKLSKLDLYCVRFDAFYCTVYARDKEDAIDKAVHPDRTWQIDGEQATMVDVLKQATTASRVTAEKTLDNDFTLR